MKNRRLINSWSTEKKVKIEGNLLLYLKNLRIIRLNFINVLERPGFHVVFSLMEVFTSFCTNDVRGEFYSTERAPKAARLDVRNG
jgi:hypothetical protein